MIAICLAVPLAVILLCLGYQYGPRPDHSRPQDEAASSLTESVKATVRSQNRAFLYADLMAGLLGSTRTFSKKPASSVALEALFNQDTGDLDGFPHAPGIRRLFSMPAAAGDVRAYVSDEPASDLKSWYQREMSRTWQSQGMVGPGTMDAMYFTRGDQFCLILISSRKTDGSTIILVNIGHN